MLTINTTAVAVSRHGRLYILALVRPKMPTCEYVYIHMCTWKFIRHIRWINQPNEHNGWVMYQFETAHSFTGSLLRHFFVCILGRYHPV